MTHVAMHSICAALLTLTAATAPAQNFPSKPIRIVVPYPPGGADMTAPPIAQQARIKLGQ